MQAQAQVEAADTHWKIDTARLEAQLDAVHAASAHAALQRSEELAVLARQCETLHADNTLLHATLTSAQAELAASQAQLSLGTAAMGGDLMAKLAATTRARDDFHDQWQAAMRQCDALQTAEIGLQTQLISGLAKLQDLQDMYGQASADLAESENSARLSRQDAVAATREVEALREQLLRQAEALDVSESSLHLAQVRVGVGVRVRVFT